MIDIDMDDYSREQYENLLAAIDEVMSRYQVPRVFTGDAWGNWDAAVVELPSRLRQLTVCGQCKDKFRDAFRWVAALEIEHLRTKINDLMEGAGNG